MSLAPERLSELESARAAAAERFQAAALPTERDENFRYGRIDDLDLSRFSRLVKDASPGEAQLSEAAQDLLRAVGDVAAFVVVRDGQPAVSIPEGGATDGLSVTMLSQLGADPEGFSSLIARVDEPFGDLARSAAEDSVIIEVRAGIRVERPVLVVHELTSKSADATVAPRAFVRVGEASELSVIELFVSGDDALLILPLTELVVGDGAQLRYHAIQELGQRAWQLGYQLSSVGRDGALRSFSAALGGDYARLYTSCALEGTNSESQLLATYFARREQVQDMRTFQEHAVGHTKSDLVFKGAVADAARSVYTGLIHIAKGATRSNAAQTNRNLVLSEGAHADSVPNLDIEENDVRCSHASAVGPIDAEQRFYLESRGVPSEAAERLILLGFFDDLFDRVSEPGVAEHLRREFTAAIDEVSA